MPVDTGDRGHLGEPPRRQAACSHRPQECRVSRKMLETRRVGAMSQLRVPDPDLYTSDVILWGRRTRRFRA